VYLSKNSLVSLAGLEQFHSVRSLSLSDNLLRGWEDIAVLDPESGAFPALEVLTLDGNPIAALPNYRLGIHTLCLTHGVLD
jgi:Leucine-rich repeat (LRR) protein